VENNAPQDDPSRHPAQNDSLADRSWAGNRPAVNAGYRTVVLLLLTLVYTFNFIDRQIIGNLSPFIKADLGLADWQLGLLKGFAFALLYSVLGIPIAWVADRYSRVKIVAVSLALWSGFTALSGLAGSFATLGLARLGVGIGEAGGSPPSHSIISDLYPKEQRTSALAVYSLGIPVGIMFSFFAAGLLVESFGWRGTFYALGIPGVLLSLAILIVIKEPQRGAMEMRDGKSAAVKQSTGESISTLLSIPAWWGMCLGIAFTSFGSYSVGTWGVDYVTRHNPEYSFTRLMTILGLINGIAFGAGTYFGGLVAERWARTNVRAFALVPAITTAIGIPFFVASFWVESVDTYLACIAVYLLMAGCYLGPSFAIAQTLAPISARAMSTALFFLVLNLIGLGGGPTYIGFLSGFLTEQHGETHALRLAMTSVGLIFVIAVSAYLYAAKNLPADWARAAQRNEG
jgi:MFS family permease